MLFGSLASATLAYRGGEDVIVPIDPPATIDSLAEGRAEVATALRARRATAASFAVALTTLFLFVVLVPYRRGDVWSWWAILVTFAVLGGLVLLRIPILDTTAGVPAGGIPLAAVVVALLLDVKRLSS